MFLVRKSQSPSGQLDHVTFTCFAYWWANQLVQVTLIIELILFISYNRSSWTFINVVVELDLKRSGQAGP
jgi:hypothetical protein